MGTFFVNIAGNGFWMNAGILELWLRLAALHLEDQLDDHSIVHTIRNEWLLASRGYFGNAVPLDLSANISTPEGRRAVVDAIGALLTALRKGPAHLDAGVLNLLGIEGQFEMDIESAQLIEVAEAFLALIDGKTSGGVVDTSFMPGSRRRSPE